MSGLLFLLMSCSVKNDSEPSTNSKTGTSTSTEITNKQTTTPTLFIHGYKGTVNSFGKMIKRLEGKKETKKELTLKVNSDGEIQAQGVLTGTETNPSVQVIFEDNQSHEWNQAEWIKNCLAYLRVNFGIKRVNVVGHSMGGASTMRYLTTFSMDETLPTVEKFVGIAAPFNNFTELPETETLEDVITNGPTIQSQRYLDYMNGTTNISPEMKVLLIVGDLEDGSKSDGVVTVTDGLSIVPLLRNHGNDVKEEILYGKMAQHSQLHENSEVDQFVADFLWK